MTLPPTQALDWESRYQEETAHWERGEPNPAFLAWRASGALTPRRILVPGAGRSPEPAALAEAGFDVTVVDMAASAVAAQRAALGRFPAARVAQADLLHWTPDAPFDAIYDQTCFCALPPPVWRSYEASLRRWLRPDGALFILFMQTGREGGPPFDCPLDAMRGVFDAAAWSWPPTLPETVPLGSLFREQPAVLTRRTGFA